MKLMQYTRPGLGWPTFGRLTTLQDELTRLFDSSAEGWTPALDVHEDKDSYSIRVELPGMKREEIEVSLQDEALVISGERKTGTGRIIHSYSDGGPATFDDLKPGQQVLITPDEDLAKAKIIRIFPDDSPTTKPGS